MKASGVGGHCLPQQRLQVGRAHRVVLVEDDIEPLLLGEVDERRLHLHSVLYADVHGGDAPLDLAVLLEAGEHRGKRCRRFDRLRQRPEYVRPFRRQLDDPVGTGCRHDRGIAVLVEERRRGKVHMRRIGAQDRDRPCPAGPSARSSLINSSGCPRSSYSTRSIGTFLPNFFSMMPPASLVRFCQSLYCEIDRRFSAGAERTRDRDGIADPDLVRRRLRLCGNAGQRRQTCGRRPCP